jgi:hypothetical protein
MLMEPTTLLPLHLTISYLQWHSICRPFVFWLLHTVEKFNTEMPADGNGSKGNSQCFQIVHVVPALYEQWIPCQMPLQRPHTQIMVWIYNWIFDRKRKSVIWNGFVSFTCEDKQGPKLMLYRQRFTMWWYECALTRLIQVWTTINCGWDNKIYYCGRTFHASAPVLMKLLCWLAAGQEEKQYAKSNQHTVDLMRITHWVWPCCIRWRQQTNDYMLLHMSYFCIQLTVVMTIN